MLISTLADGNMSSPTTAVMCSTTLYARLPLEIELYVVQALIETHKRSEKPGFCLSTFASVSKPWQSLIERETFNHIKIASHELDLFKTRVRSYRTRLVKHILLEIPYNVSSSGDDDQVQFSKAVHALWRILSTWKTHRVTVELGIFSTEARQLIKNVIERASTTTLLTLRKPSAHTSSLPLTFGDIKVSNSWAASLLDLTELPYHNKVLRVCLTLTPSRS